MLAQAVWANPICFLWLYDEKVENTLETIDTIFGRFLEPSRGRLTLTYDYETSAIFSFLDIARLIEATIILDVGSNIGVYSVYCLSLPLVERVHAFEPAPAAYDLLRANVNLQPRREQIFVHNIAASDSTGEVEFNIISELSGANAVAKPGSKGDRIFVKADRIDNVISLADKCMAVKVDVEGHELKALSGMRELLVRNECYVQVECLSAELLSELREFMMTIGYTYVFSLRDDHLFVSTNLKHRIPKMLEIISTAVSADLQHLLLLRQKIRQVSLSARRLRDLAGYRKDPLFLSRDQSPF